MSTRSGKIYTRSNIQRPITKNKSKKNNVPLVIEEDCAICQEVLNDGQTPVTTLTNCNHKFHEQCINQWMNTNQANAHECPLCRAPINYNQWPPPIAPQQPQFQQPQQPQMPESERRLQQVIAFENSRGQTPVPFLGIVICINGEMIIKYLNTDLGLGTNNTINDLKDAILGRSLEIAGQRGFFCQTNFGRHVNNAVATTGFTRRREPSFRINRIGFGVPASCETDTINFAFNNYANDWLEGTFLGNLYRSYQENARIILGSYGIDVPDNLHRVYKKHTIRFQTGIFTTDYFLNMYNPDIPEEFRPDYPDDRDIKKATKISLAWLIVDIECTTLAGGKTRKRRLRKNRKSKKMKRRKSNK
jgi:hypothetical protein